MRSPRLWLEAVLAVVAVPVAAGWAFAVFGCALWANIYVDGHPSASTGEVLIAVLPTLGPFLAASLAVVTAGRAFRMRLPEIAFGGAAAVLLPVMTFGYAIPTLAAASLPFLIRDVVARKRLRLPPLDIVTLAAGALLIVFWAFAEAHR